LQQPPNLSPSSPAGDPDTPSISGQLRVVLLVLGWLFVALAAIGVVLPVVPTTPFLLVAAACFARSSPRFYRWLIDSRTFGPTIRAWRATRTIPRRAKLSALVVLALVAGGSAVFCLHATWARAVFLAVVIAVATWIARIPTTESIAAERPPDDTNGGQRTTRP
jgi:uncharacterized membrane protein YbaN (DUF454 family)